MAVTLKASEQGLNKVDEVRRNLGWLKTDSAWCQKANVKESALKRFWQRLPIVSENFISICTAVECNWEEIRETVGEETENKDDGLALPDWKECCRKMLEKYHQNLTTNSITRDQNTLKYEDVYINKVPQKILEKNQENAEIKMAFTQKNRLAIIGKPGCGKTTYLQAKSFELIKKNHLVIWISLGDLGEKTITAYLLDNWLKNALETEYIEQKIKADFINLFKSNQNKIWLLLDGIDEMSIEPAKVLAMIEQQLTGWLGKAAIAITCRYHLWYETNNPLSYFQVYEILPFDDKEVKNFIEKWFKENQELQDKLLNYLAQPVFKQIQELIKIPLMLTMLCYTCERLKKLPESKFDVYRELVESLYEWKKNRFPLTFTEKNMLDQLLMKLAVDLTEKNLTEFTQTDLQQYLEKDQDFIHKQISWWELALEIGLINKFGDKYSFFHVEFQCYFAVLEINKLPGDQEKYFFDMDKNSKKLLKTRIFDNLWIQVFLLWLEIGEEQKNAARYIIYILITLLTREYINPMDLEREIIAKTLKKIIPNINISLQRNVMRNLRESATKLKINSRGNEEIFNIILNVLINTLNHSKDYQTILPTVWGLRDVAVNSSQGFDALIDLYYNRVDSLPVSQEHKNILYQQIRETLVDIYLDTDNENLLMNFAKKLARLQLL
jgi:DNA replication protein DnaC